MDGLSCPHAAFQLQLCGVMIHHRGNDLLFLIRRQLAVRTLLSATLLRLETCQALLLVCGDNVTDCMPGISRQLLDLVPPDLAFPQFDNHLPHGVQGLIVGFPIVNSFFGFHVYVIPHFCRNCNRIAQYFDAD